MRQNLDSQVFSHEVPMAKQANYFNHMALMCKEGNSEICLAHKG